MRARRSRRTSLLLVRQTFSFIISRPISFTLASIISLANVLVMLAIFALALAVAANSWQLALGAGALFALRVLGFSRGILRYADLYLGHKLMFDFVTSARLRLFRSLAAQGARMLPAGEALQLMVNLLQRLDGVYLRLLMPISTMVLTVLSVVLLLVIYAHWFYAVIVLVSIGAPMLIVSTCTWRANIGAQLRADDFQRLRKLLLADFFNALPDWLSLDNRHSVLRAVQVHQQREHHYNQYLLQIQALGLLAYQLLQAIGLLTAILFVSTRAIISMGDFVALVALLVLQRLGHTYLPALLEITQLSTAWRRCTQLTGMEQEQQLISADERSGASPIVAKANLELRDVCFKYPNAPTATLINCSLTIKSGERILLSGASGSGKSTLVYLLGALLPADSGKISYGARRLTNCSDDTWRTIFAISTQQRQILNCSLREQLFSPRSDSELSCVLGDVGLNSWLNNLPAGLDTRIGEGAVQPSGGQYQLLQLARMLLSSAPIWIFDEISNGLDRARRTQVMELINARIGERTLIYISHAREQLPNIDRCITLEAGRIAAVN